MMNRQEPDQFKYGRVELLEFPGRPTSLYVTDGNGKTRYVLRLKRGPRSTGYYGVYSIQAVERYDPTIHDYHP